MINVAPAARTLLMHDKDCGLKAVHWTHQNAGQRFEIQHYNIYGFPTMSHNLILESDCTGKFCLHLASSLSRAGRTL